METVCSSPWASLPGYYSVANRLCLSTFYGGWNGKIRRLRWGQVEVSTPAEPSSSVAFRISTAGSREKILWSNFLCVLEKQPFPGSCSQGCGFAAEKEQEGKEGIGWRIRIVFQQSLGQLIPGLSPGPTYVTLPWRLSAHIGPHFSIATVPSVSSSSCWQDLGPSLGHCLGLYGPVVSCPILWLWEGRNHYLPHEVINMFWITCCCITFLE